MKAIALARARCALMSLVAFYVAGCATTSPPSLVAPLGSPTRLSRLGPPIPIRAIVIDAGHGGHDPGTSHFGIKEKNITLDIARRLRDRLNENALTVVMTRDSDRFIPLSARPAVANNLEANLFVSVHINANPSRHVSGIEVYYPRESSVSSSAQWPPWIRPGEIGIPSTTVKQILWDMVLGRSRSYSRRLASSICRAMRDGLQVPCRGTKAARFVVLREAWMPSALVEVGYVTNRNEASRLRNSDYRAAAASAIAQGIVNYLRDTGSEPL